MTFGVALTIRSCLGSSVISSIPMAMTLVGEADMAPALTVGTYTNIMNMLLVVVQILILRSKFEKVQLFQLIIGSVFGWLLDINMLITSCFISGHISLIGQITAQIMGCVVLGTGIAFEMKCGSITMPGEGVPAAICRLRGIPFAKVKICVDIILVVIAVIIGYCFFGRWLINVVGFGTLFAMVFVGLVVKWVDARISWFDRLLDYRHGLGRYVYGLARVLHLK